MAVPKKRTSASRRDKRKANWKLEAPNLVECPHCHVLILPHRVCPDCGWYRGKQVVKIEER
jgi:large subunit ribosomal protein L32